jgi:hypothetical protein
MAIPTTSWDETSPAGSQSRALGDDRIREMKTQLREVIAVDHIMSSSGNSATTGYHNWVTFQTQGSDPLNIANTFRLFAKDVSDKAELHLIDEDGNTQQLTSGGQWVGGIQYEIRMWSGLTSAIPAGWVLCDGSNSTPDLTSRFVRGVAEITERVFTGAGADSHTHTINNHTHTTDSHTHTYSGTTDEYSPAFNAAGDGVTASPRHAHTYSGTTNGSGNLTTGNPSDRGMDTISNIPAYIPLAYIMKS